MSQKRLEEVRQLMGLTEGRSIPPSNRTGEDEDHPPLWRAQYHASEEFHAEYGALGKSQKEIQRGLSSVREILERGILEYVREMMKSNPGIFDPVRSEIASFLRGAERALRSLEEGDEILMNLVQKDGKRIADALNRHAISEYEKWKTVKS